MPTLCKCCGQIVPPAGLPEGLRLSPMKQRIWETVTRRPGLSASELFREVYSPYYDGGPEDFNNVRVALCQMNRLLRVFELEISNRDRLGYRVKGI